MLLTYPFAKSDFPLAGFAVTHRMVCIAEMQQSVAGRGVDAVRVQLGEWNLFVSFFKAEG